jgi:hypothetical protein
MEGPEGRLLVATSGSIGHAIPRRPKGPVGG